MARMNASWFVFLANLLARWWIHKAAGTETERMSRRVPYSAWFTTFEINLYGRRLFFSTNLSSTLARLETKIWPYFLFFFFQANAIRTIISTVSRFLRVVYCTGWSIIRIIQEVGQPERTEEKGKKKWWKVEGGGSRFRSFLSSILKTSLLWFGSFLFGSCILSLDRGFKI